MVQRALEENDPYALAFVDIRMPPGWDGVETLEHLWQCSPELQAVICTAYSDYSWDDMSRRLSQVDSLLILKKPFDTAEVLQVAHALTRKWALARQAKLRMEDLDRMVRERTQELQQEIQERARVQEAQLKLEAQLRQAQKLEAVGCLAAGIAHEFNNLLTVIQGHTDLLSGKPLGTRAATESIARIAQASQRAASLTRRLLAFSHKQPMRFKPIELSAAVQGLAKMLGQLIGEPYQLCLDCAANLPAIRADEGNVEQILINLSLNARDAMPDGGTIQVGTTFALFDEAAARDHLEARPGRFVCLTVSDTGCGMSREVLGRIFDPFYTTKDVGKGTGLGLSTVHGIVQQHAGWIEVASEIGKGSTFKVFLPLWEGTPGGADWRSRRRFQAPARFRGGGADCRRRGDCAGSGPHGAGAWGLPGIRGWGWPGSIGGVGTVSGAHRSVGHRHGHAAWRQRRRAGQGAASTRSPPADPLHQRLQFGSGQGRPAFDPRRQLPAQTLRPSGAA